MKNPDSASVRPANWVGAWTSGRETIAGLIVELVLPHSDEDVLRLDTGDDGRVKLIDDVRLIAPRRIAIRGGIDSLGDHVARRLAETALMINPA